MAGMSNEGNAKLVPADAADGTDPVPFRYNPATIMISRSVKMTPSTARSTTKSGGNAPADNSSTPTSTTVQVSGNAGDPVGIAMANNFTTIGIRAVTFDGQSVRAYCEQLLLWTQVKPVKDTNGTQRDLPPKLNFIWGSQIYLVMLYRVTINYTRFGRTGTPVRATVDLVLNSVPEIPGPTNPSSGGLAGRRSHLLIGAETLPELATRYYGGPGRWREIAAANGVEDPLRVRPGTRVYVPSELEAGR
jgi:hypothetical protein